MGCRQSVPHSPVLTRHDKSEEPHRNIDADRSLSQQKRRNSRGPTSAESIPDSTVAMRRDKPDQPRRNVDADGSSSQRKRRNSRGPTPEEGIHDSTAAVHRDKPEQHHRNIVADESTRQRRRSNVPEPGIEEEMHKFFLNEDGAAEKIIKGIPFQDIVNKYPRPPTLKDIEEFRDKNSIFMIESFKYDRSHPNHEPVPINDGNGYTDLQDENHVFMPCSRFYTSRDRKPIWPVICEWLTYLKRKCDDHEVVFKDLKKTIESFGGCHNDMGGLEILIEKIYSNDERASFMYTTLSKMCDLVLHLNLIFTKPPPLLRIGSNKSVTMSQKQAATLLACAFFCFFPYRSDQSRTKQFEKYPNPNFDRLYQSGPPEKMEKLKCILHYFRRVTEKIPTGVITIQRFALPDNLTPRWSESTTVLCDLHLTTGEKIEDVNNVLQVDFANKYIGGGVLGSGCVQEEIRFSICPEMLVSLLVCEVMEKNECIFLIGCERYSQYKGYAGSFKFAGNYDDNTPKDDLGRKWCHLVAMDAIFFRDKSTQYHMKNVNRELLKAYTSFRPLGNGPGYEYGIATGNWGCGAFNGDRQLKAIIQLMAASEARRPLVYAAFGDKKLVNSFSEVYNYLRNERATVSDLSYYLHQYSDRYNQSSLFEYILKKPVSSLRS